MKATTAIIPFSTNRCFRRQWLTWRFLGLNPPIRYRQLYWIYSAILNISITVFYPLSLTIKLFMVRKLAPFLQNLSINLSDVCCSVKFFNIFLQRNELKKIKPLNDELDARIKDDKEKDYMNSIIRVCGRYFFLLGFLDTTFVLTAALAVLIRPGRHILYPAWFPFDWEASHRNWMIAYLYQTIGMLIQAVQQPPQDMCLPAYLYIATGHLWCLKRRLAKLGYDVSMTQEENYTELLRCITDYKTLIKYSKILEKSLSGAMFFQFLITGAVLCVTGIYWLYLDPKPIQFVNFGVYFMAVSMQIAIPCYFGSNYTKMSSDLTNAIYFSNWIEQSPKYKKAAIIFMQRTQKENFIKTWNWITVSKPTFLSIMRTAYSTFAVLRTANNKNKKSF